jgi:hypothetical protein
MSRIHWVPRGTGTPKDRDEVNKRESGGVKEPTLSHHTFFTTKLIPRLDKLIDDKNMGKMKEMTRDLTASVFSDGVQDSCQISKDVFPRVTSKAS